MATFYKCDKCGKNIQGQAIAFSFNDLNRIFFEKSFNRFEFCQECSKPLAGLIKKFLLNKKNKK